MTPRTRLLLGTCVTLGMLAASTSIGLAANADLSSVHSGWNTSSAPLPPEPPPGNPGTADEEPPSETILQTIIQTIFFPFETLAEGVRTALGELFSKAAIEALAPMKETLNTATGWLLPNGATGGTLQDLRLRAWRAMAAVAGVLIPLALMITVGSAMREGVTSITGYADAREALLSWLIGVGAAAASYFLLEKAIDLSNAMSMAVGESMGHAAVQDWNLGDQLLGAFVNLQLLEAAGPLMQLFLGFFALFTMIAVVGSITIALLAREVLFLLLVALAPVIFIMGSIQPLAWLRGLWTKATVLTLLLGPANYLLLTLAGMLAAKANALSSGIATAILGMLIALGIISVLIAMNSMVGKLVYGAAMEITKKAWGSTMGVLQLGALAAGFALAPAVGGMLGGGAGVLGGGSAPGPLAGAGLSGGKLASGLSTAGTTAGIAGGTFGSSRKVSDLAGSIGHALAASRNPIARGFGRGLVGGGALDTAGHNASPGLIPRITEPVDSAAGLTTAREELEQRFAGDEKSAASIGLPREEASAKLREGVALGGNAFRAMERLGVDPGTALRDLGYYRGANMHGAVTSFGRVTASRWALGHRSPYPPPQALVQPGPQVGGHDLQAALDIVHGPGRAEGLQTASPRTLSQLALTVHQRRVQLGDSLGAIVDEASRLTTSSELRSWMTDAYYNLPDRGAAERLGQELGIVPADPTTSRFAGHA